MPRSSHLKTTLLGLLLLLLPLLPPLPPLAPLPPPTGTPSTLPGWAVLPLGRPSHPTPAAGCRAAGSKDSVSKHVVGDDVRNSL
jgi:hypothetical protein